MHMSSTIPLNSHSILYINFSDFLNTKLLLLFFRTYFSISPTFFANFEYE